MNGEKKVILHLMFDGIFFDRIYSRFEEMDSYENRYLFGSLNTDEEIKYIKNTEKLIRTDSLEKWGQVVSDPQIDIVYLHGLWYDYLKAIDYIRDGVVVMWWCYGMELYENCFNQPPLLQLNLYKPQTSWFILSQYNGLMTKLNNYFSLFHPQLHSSLKSIMGRNGFDKNLKRFLARIDYAFTPIEFELDELKRKYSFIKAKPYRLLGTKTKDTFVSHNNAGSILLEHSANISNNHLDIIALVKKKKINLSGRDIYIPLSYGEKEMAVRVEKEANFENANTHCLKEALPFEQYNEMVNGCTHAFFGMIRQSGLGNIHMCFRKGIKVFFFKESVLYNYFKTKGYHVFSMEDDLNDISIKEPLTFEEAKNNYERFCSFFDNNLDYQQQMNNILKS